MRQITTEQYLPSFSPKRVFPLCLIALLASCGSGDSDADRRADDGWKVVDSSERAGAREGESPASAHGAATSADKFSFDTPEGWVEAAPTELRILNFKVAGRDDASCYLTAMPGLADKVLDNVNRWRSQFGAEAMTLEQVGSLPKAVLFNIPAVRVEVSGPFSDGMGGSEIAEGSLLGLIAQQDNTMAFLKMVGPKDVIAQEVERFDAFSKSLTFLGAPAPEPNVGQERTLLHEVPADWTAQESRPMRQLGFDLPGGVDLSVTILGGAAGGVAANINRWRGQLGLAVVPEAELLAGERINCFGQSAYWVELSGAYTGMEGEAKDTQDIMMAVVVPMANETIFVKCVGSSEAMQKVEPALRTFVGSLGFEESK